MVSLVKGRGVDRPAWFYLSSFRVVYPNPHNGSATRFTPYCAGRQRPRQRFWLAAIIAALTCTSLHAAEDDNNTERDRLTIEITPLQTRSSSTQDVATTSSLSEQQLDSAAVAGTSDLPQQIPGFVFPTSSGSAEPYLRGIGGTVSAVGDSSVSTFVDGVFLTRSVQALRDFYDTQQVNVRFGPSATAFGHNVEGGAISIVTRDPGPELGASADVLFGNYAQREMRATINAPIGDSGFSARLAGAVIRRDGFSENIYLDKEIDDRDYYSWRFKIGYRRDSNLKIVVSTEQSVQDDTRGMGGQPDPDIGVNGGLLLGGTVPADNRDVMRNVEDRQDNERNLTNVRLNWNAGIFELISTTAMQETNVSTVTDLDGTEINYSSRYVLIDANAISQELRVRSVGGRALAWESGLFYQREEIDNTLDVRLPLLGFKSVSQSDAVDTTSALFAALSCELSTQWRVRSGLRYSHDALELDLTQQVTSPLGNRTIPYQAKNDWDTVTPEVAIVFSPAMYRFFYLNVARGFKSGGYNAYAAEASYSPETLTAYETGTRLEFPSVAMRLNAALFYYDYRDIQIVTLPPGSPSGTLPIVDNAARASVRGLEFKATYQPGDFSLNAGATFLDANFDKFDSVDPNNPTNDSDRSGDPLPNAPDLSAVLGLDYLWRVHAAGGVRMGLDYRYQSKVYFNPYADPAVSQGAYSLINGTVRYIPTSGFWYAELWGRNLTDKEYAQNVIRIDPSVGTRRVWGEPRTYGIRVGFKF